MWDQLAITPPSGLTDAGPELLKGFRRDLAMDAEWTDLDGRSLTWWGAPLPMMLMTGVPRLCEGDATIKVTASVVAVQDVTADGDSVAIVLDEHNRLASVGAFTWILRTRQVVAHLTHYSYEDDNLTELFAPFALAAYTEAVAAADDMARRLGGRPATRPHPTSGFRADCDELLTVTERLVIPQGGAPNAWSSGELASITSLFIDWGLAATGGGSAVTAEFPILPDIFSDRTETALLQMLREHHPTYGTGLLALLRLPTLYDPPAAADLANQLNAAELESLIGTPGFGAWCTGTLGTSVVHAVFLPNTYSRPGLATAIGLHALARSRWAAEWFGARRHEERELQVVPDEKSDRKSPTGDHVPDPAPSTEISAIPLDQLKPQSANTWLSGWLGIEYGTPVHGFGELFVLAGRGATISFWWMAGDGGVYQSVDLKYDCSLDTVDFYIGLQADKPHEREESVIVPLAVRDRMRELVGRRSMYPQELFTRMVVLYAPMFQIMTPGYAVNDLFWYDRWYHRVPTRSDLWRPVDLGTGLTPFTNPETQPAGAAPSA